MKNLKRILLMLLYFMLAKSNYIDAQFTTYQPNDNTPVKFVKINVHFLRDANGNNGFNEANGKTAALSYFRAINERLANMPAINLKVNNATVPTLPSKYRFVIYPLYNDPNDPDHDGIYFHNDNNFYLFNSIWITGSVDQRVTVYNLYGSGKAENVINVFITYGTSSGNGVAGGIPASYCFVKSDNILLNNPNTWDQALDIETIQHELGHCIGLEHTWAQNDGCDDTPLNSKCWNLDPTNVNCNSMDKVSNNMMDYNGAENAITPCQLGKVHSTLSNAYVNYTTNNYYDCSALATIAYNINQTILNSYTGSRIQTNPNFQVNVDFTGSNNISLVALEKVSLKSGFKVHALAGTIFTAKTSNLCTSIPLNSNEATWDANHKNLFGLKTSGSARLDSATTNGMTSFQMDCGSGGGSSSRIESPEMVQLETNSIIYPNPNDGTFTINFPSSEAACEVQIVDLLGNVVLKENVSNTLTKNYSLTNLSNGMYIVNLIGNGIQKRTKVQVIR